jgi:hypothetical protein
MSDTLFTTNEPHAEEIAELVEIGMLVPVEVDHEAASRAAHRHMDGRDVDDAASRMRSEAVLFAALGIGGDDA